MTLNWGWRKEEGKGKERKGKKRKGKERKGKERKRKEKKGKVMKGKEGKGKRMEEKIEILLPPYFCQHVVICFQRCREGRFDWREGGDEEGERGF